MRPRMIRILARPSARLLSTSRFPLLPPARSQLRITPFRTQLRRWFSQPPLVDPSRPDLFYHLLPLPTEPDPSQSIPIYALSFLSSPPPSPRSATILGWLPAVTDSGSEDVDAGLNDFVENPRFRPLLHKAVQQTLREGADDVWTNGAIQIQQGWMHIHDYRNIPALGRIGDPDDIIASVLVEDSKILPDTYQAMPSYRFCTADGPTQLTEGLAEKLKGVLEGVAWRESNDTDPGTGYRPNP